MRLDRSSMLLYAVTDRSWLNGASLSEQVEESIKAGVTFVQVREKDIPFDELVKASLEIKSVTDRYKVPFVVNDDVDAAIACGADGVHIGQGDARAEHVRERIGKDRILGVSAQTVEQALAAEKSGADYIGVGAVFSTSTKSDADQVSLDTLKAICDSVSVPVVAIGGIGKHNIMSLKGIGLDGVAVVSAIFAQKDISVAVKELRGLAERMAGFKTEGDDSK